MKLLPLAYRNFKGYRSQYKSLVISLGTAGLFMLLLAGLVNGLSEGINRKALAYYGGEFSVFVHRKTPEGHLISEISPTAGAVLREVPTGLDLSVSYRGFHLRHVFRRYIRVSTKGRVQDLRLVFGVDRAEEVGRNLQGESLHHPKAGEALIPLSLAESLGLQRGDSFLFQFSTYQGQRSSATLTVAGLYHDDPVFGAGILYLDRAFLNTLTGKPAAWAGEGVYSFDRLPGEADLVRLHEGLAKHLDVWDIPESKAAFLAGYDQEEWLGEKAVLLPLSLHVQDLTQMIQGLRLLLLALTALLIFVSVMGLQASIRVVMYERIREIGTLGALGLTRRESFLLLGCEGALIGFFAALFSIVANLTLSGLITMVPLEDPGFFELLRKGRGIGLGAVPAESLLWLVLAVSASVIAVTATVLKPVTASPAVSLSSQLND